MSIHKKGLTPDFAIEASSETDESQDNQLQRALELVNGQSNQ